MKNLLKLIPIFCILFFASCKDEETYPANPYNHIGEEHNTILSKFYDLYGDEVELIMDKNEKEFFVAQKMAELTDEDPELLQKGKEWMGMNQDALLSEFDFSKPEAIFKKIEISSEVREKLNKTVNELKDLDPTDEKLIEKTDELILDLEQDLFKDFQFEEDFQPAMTYLATLKYSTKFWKGKSDIPQAQKAKWWKVVLADAAGALVGVGVTYITVGAGAATTVAMASSFSGAVALIK